MIAHASISRLLDDLFDLHKVRMPHIFAASAKNNQLSNVASMIAHPF
jgi:hypothetical protein